MEGISCIIFATFCASIIISNRKLKKKKNKGKRQYGGRNTYIHIIEILSNMKRLNSCKKSANTTKKEQS